MIINFDFVEIEHEVWALREYFRTMEQQLPDIVRQETKRVDKELENTDEVEWEFAHQHLDDLTENVLPRVFRAQVLVSLWAIYEAGINEIAEHLEKAESHDLGHRDIKGKNKLDGTRKYFDHILKFPLFSDDKTKEALEMLLALRNAIAHGNGREDAINEDTLSRIERWKKQGKEITASGGYLKFSPSFIAEMLDMVESSLHDLIERARAVK